MRVDVFLFSFYFSYVTRKILTFQPVIVIYLFNLKYVFRYDKLVLEYDLDLQIWLMMSLVRLYLFSASPVLLSYASPSLLSQSRI